MALSQSGCRVTTCSLPGHPFEKTGIVARKFSFDALHPVRSVLASLQQELPDFLVACDERATLILHQLYVANIGEDQSAAAIRKLLTYSLGNPENFDAACSRSSVMERAASLGIRIPDGQNVDSPGAMEAWFGAHGFPAYLKADGTSGGVGVRLVHALAEARSAYRKLHAPPKLARVAKRLLVNRDPVLLLPFLRRERPEISVQRDIHGREATCATACWKGEVLSSLSMEVLQRTEPQGPASVLRQIENAEMSRAAELLVRSLGLTGLVGLDFIIEESTGATYLLELNLRATQTAHLCMGPRHSPAFALGARLQGLSTDCVPQEGRREVALFPQEWIRDPQSRYLKGSFHDIPLQAPELVRAALKGRSHRFSNATAEECLKAVQSSSLGTPA